MTPDEQRILEREIEQRLLDRKESDGARTWSEILAHEIVRDFIRPLVEKPAKKKKRAA